MPLSIAEFARGREVTAALLDQLGLATYLFEIESAGDGWRVRVDCALEGDAWQSVILPVNKDALLEAASDEAVRARILREWRTRLEACSLRAFPD
jgi:hypothetical protein